LQVSSAVDADGNSLPGFKPASLDFTAGDGEVCDALEFATFEMKKGEQALLTCTKPQQCAEPKLGLATVQASKVVLTVQLDEFEKGKDTWSMSEDEKMQYGEARKAAGGNLFKQQRIELALKAYSSVISTLTSVDKMAEANKKRAQELKRTCELNKAACLLKTKDWDGARKCCNTVLKDESNNVKALFRRATANKELGEYLDAMKDCKLILEQDNANADARRMIPQLKALQKVEDNKSKGLFANMCKGLGKLNTPEPFVSKPVVEDDFDDEDDEDDDVPMHTEGDDENATESPPVAKDE